MSTPTLLLIDDEPEVLNSLRRNIRHWAGSHRIHLLTADSAETAGDFISSGEWDVQIIITDQRMPGMKGHEFIREIRITHPDIVAIVLTGYTDTEDLEKLLNSGFFTYLLKPWNNENLILELDKAKQHYHAKKRERLINRKIKQELKLGAEFQKALQQNIEIPRSEDISFKVTGIPTSQLDFSGDYYDIIRLSSDRYITILGDVAGHGLNSAFIGAILKAVIYPEFIKPVRDDHFSPAEFLRLLNLRVIEIMRKIPQVLISLSAGYIDLSVGTFTYASAGLPPAVLLRDRQVILMGTPRMPLGTSTQLLFEEEQTDLKPGDISVFYTDGLHPSGNNTSDFTEEDLFSIFLKVFRSNEFGDDASHQEVLKRIKKEVRVQNFEDDVTLMSFHLRK